TRFSRDWSSDVCSSDLVSEQIDALEIMGINTRTYLIMPKVLAALIMVPCLIVISIAVTIWGGYIAGMFSSILSKEQFKQGLTQRSEERRVGKEETSREY